MLRIVLFFVHFLILNLNYFGGVSCAEAPKSYKSWLNSQRRDENDDSSTDILEYLNFTLENMRVDFNRSDNLSHNERVAQIPETTPKTLKNTRENTKDNTKSNSRSEVRSRICSNHTKNAASAQKKSNEPNTNAQSGLEDKIINQKAKSHEKRSQSPENEPVDSSPISVHYNYYFTNSYPKVRYIPPPPGFSAHNIPPFIHSVPHIPIPAAYTPSFTYPYIQPQIYQSIQPQNPSFPSFFHSPTCPIHDKHFQTYQNERLFPQFSCFEPDLSQSWDFDPSRQPSSEKFEPVARRSSRSNDLVQDLLQSDNSESTSPKLQSNNSQLNKLGKDLVKSNTPEPVIPQSSHSQTSHSLDSDLLQSSSFESKPPKSKHSHSNCSELTLRYFPLFFDETTPRKRFKSPYYLNKIIGTQVLKSLLNCLFSVKKFRRFIYHVEHQIPHFRILKNLYNLGNNNSPRFKQEAHEFLLSIWDFNRHIDPFKSARNCFNILQTLILSLIDTCMCLAVDIKFPFLVESYKIGRMPDGTNPRVLNIQRSCIFPSIHLKKVPGFFPENIVSNKVDLLCSSSQRSKILKPNWSSVFQSANGVILQCVPDEFITGDPKKELFTQEILENGIIHENLGAMKLKSGMFFDLNPSRREYFSLFIDKNGKWCKQGIEKKEEVNILEFIKKREILIFFVFLEIEDSELSA